MWFLEFHLNRAVFPWKGIGALWLVIFNRFLNRYNFADIPRIYSLVSRGSKCKIVSKPLQTLNCGHSLGIVMRFRNEILFIIACFTSVDSKLAMKRQNYIHVGVCFLWPLVYVVLRFAMKN